MTDAIRHRGPDGEGAFVGASVALGHRRLAIIDPAGGAQPMFSDCRSIVVVCNGEIYNYVELRSKLQRRGYQFKTRSDTEVILRAYEDRGVQCLDEFNGMFALAIWDARDQSLCLARDRLGEKPLFYHHDADRGRLVFASELKSLLKHPDIRPEVSATALDDYLAYGYLPGDTCIFRGIAKVPAASRLIWRRGTVTLESYWSLQFGGAPVSDEREAVDELERRLRESVRIRLRSDVPLGVFLSGGVDSSAVVALASQVSSNGRLKTYSVGFDSAEHDELRFARLVADRFGTDHEEIRVSDHDISVLPDLVYHLDEPFADPSALPTYYVCREARRGVTVCLSGDGADEVFGGYGRYLTALRHRRIERITPNTVKRICRRAAAALPNFVRGKGALERVGLTGEAMYFAQCCKFTHDERRALFRSRWADSTRNSPRLYEPFFRERDSRPLLTILQHIDQATYLPDDILVKVDRMSMKNSLEVRVPFLDHTVVEFANSLDPRLKVRGRVGKYLLKRMLAEYLPAACLARPKMGFGIPIKHWFRGALEGYARELLLAHDAAIRRWFQPAVVQKLIDQHQFGGRDLSRKIWTLLVLELWFKEFRV